MKFFEMWWKEQTEETKGYVRDLVNRGQLEMANGGWSMHDEACPTYEDMINNHMIGHEFLAREFGVKPRIGWQIDPFGHSNTNARFFAEMGFDAWFFGRMDWADEQTRAHNKELEWVWIPNKDNILEGNKIFTHKMWNAYDWNPTQQFDMWESMVLTSRPFVINEQSSSFDAKEIAEKFLAGMQEKIEAQKTDHIFHPWGGDFQYMNAFYNYKNLDNFIEYINKNYGDQYFLKYSTPSEYIDTIASLNITWPTKYDDLFPYSSDPGNFWTGYFTSRANLKGYIRRASSITHASNQLFSEIALDQSTSEEEMEKIMYTKNIMLDAMGIAQHHDAVSGTAKQAVTNDYQALIFQAIETTERAYSKIIGEKIKQNTGF